MLLIFHNYFAISRCTLLIISPIDVKISKVAFKIWGSRRLTVICQEKSRLWQVGSFFPLHSSDINLPLIMHLAPVCNLNLL